MKNEIPRPQDILHILNEFQALLTLMQPLLSQKQNQMN